MSETHEELAYWAVHILASKDTASVDRQLWTLETNQVKPHSLSIFSRSILGTK